jgi:serine phosphatase RsbU (regulator of sigma subunit)
VSSATLQPDHKVFITTDGLAEAMNAEGQLFGFPRVQDLVKAGKTASDIADTIQHYGEEDDISIVALTRTPQ